MSRIIRSFGDLNESVVDTMRPVVTLFSGGLDSTFLLHRLAVLGVTDIHALSVDLGDIEDNETKRKIAHTFGANLHLVEGRSDFTKDFIRPAILAHAVYLGTHPISSSLSRPLIARKAIDLANRIGADAIVHTANRSQNTLRRLNGALRDLGFEGNFGTPYDLNPVDRDVKLAELKAAGVDFLSTREVSGDSNLWCREYESGFLDDPEHHDLSRVDFKWTAGPAPSHETRLRIDVANGLPVAVDGLPMVLTDLIEHLNERVGVYGHGRYTGLEHLPGGQKVLEVREMPAAWIIFKTLRHLETASLSAETLRIKLVLEQVWVREALEGRWYQPLRRATEHFFETTAQSVNGYVDWLLTAGGAETTSIVTSSPLYLRDREAWERHDILSEIYSLRAINPTQASQLMATAV